MRGLVIKNTGSWYQVRTDDGQFIECKIKGNFRLKGIRSTNPVAVGDRVQIILNQEGTAFINEIEDRKNYIVRRSSNLSKQSHILAANLDQCMLVVTINYPETSTIFIDRFLASAEAYRVPVKLVFNKVDAYDEDETTWVLNNVDDKDKNDQVLYYLVNTSGSMVKNKTNAKDGEDYKFTVKDYLITEIAIEN